MSVLGELNRNVNAIGDHPRPTRFSLRPPIAHPSKDCLYTKRDRSLIWTALAENSPGRSPGLRPGLLSAVPTGLNLESAVLTQTRKGWDVNHAITSTVGAARVHPHSAARCFPRSFPPMCEVWR